MRKTIFILLSTLILLCLVAPIFADGPTVVTTRPTITFDYAEDVSIKSYELKDSSDTEHSMTVSPVAGMHDTFYFTPVHHLNNDIYFLTVIASDLVGNTVTTFYNFTVTAPIMWIKVIEPELGVSDELVFNVTVQSERPATCKYSFDENSVKILTFDESGTNYHKLFNVNNGSGTLGNLNNDSGSTDPFETYLYLECNETSTKRIHPGVILIGFDGTDPSISPEASPNPVTDVDQPNTTLKITSNDKVICKYNNTDGAEFPGYDIGNYTYEHEVVLDYTDITELPLQEALLTYPQLYNISCKNRAGLESAVNVLNEHTGSGTSTVGLPGFVQSTVISKD